MYLSLSPPGLAVSLISLDQGRYALKLNWRTQEISDEAAKSLNKLDEPKQNKQTICVQYNHNNIRQQMTQTTKQQRTNEYQRRGGGLPSGTVRDSRPISLLVLSLLGHRDF